MKLNLGCGPFHPKGWVNVDVEPGMNPDVVASVLALPFEDDSASHVYLGHVLEHLPFEKVPDVLDETARVLRPGGSVAIVGPDIQLAWNGYRAGMFDADTVEGVINGNGCGGHDADVHLWTCEGRLMLPIVSKHFEDVRSFDITLLDPAWPLTAAVGWQFAITARNQF